MTSDIIRHVSFLRREGDQADPDGRAVERSGGRCIRLSEDSKEKLDQLQREIQYPVAGKVYTLERLRQCYSPTPVLMFA